MVTTSTKSCASARVSDHRPDRQGLHLENRHEGEAQVRRAILNAFWAHPTTRARAHGPLLVADQIGQLGGVVDRLSRQVRQRLCVPTPLTESFEREDQESDRGGRSTNSRRYRPSGHESEPPFTARPPGVRRIEMTVGIPDHTVRPSERGARSDDAGQPPPPPQD